MTTATLSPATSPSTTTLVTDEMLARFHERAPRYDRENSFFTDDFAELRVSGFLNIAVPRSHGGAGQSLAEIARLQRRIAYFAPATALATNMHIYWTGTAADLLRSGDTSMEWIFAASSEGKVFAAGHGERGHDIPIFLSTTIAERVDGGYRLSGHKMFGSLSPVWDYNGVHAIAPDAPGGPQIVHAFIPRDAPGLSIKETWDTLGMRATRSDDTLLDGVFVPDEMIVRTIPAGAPDQMTGTAFAWVQVSFGSIYLGIADRALDLAVSAAKSRGSIALTRSMAYHPEIQHLIADAVVALDGASAHIEKVAPDWSEGVDHGPAWAARLAAAKHNAVETAARVVDAAMTVSGGSGMFRSNELERLYRDVRAGGFHPANSLLVHELVGKITLGIDPGEQPRWG